MIDINIAYDIYHSIIVISKKKKRLKKQPERVAEELKSPRPKGRFLSLVTAKRTPQRTPQRVAQQMSPPLGLGKAERMILDSEGYIACCIHIVGYGVHP